MLTPRQAGILKAIIEDYISQGLPLGSKTLKSENNLPYSSATIRNEMAVLESLGLLEKKHSSSGRVPSNRGYRYYVDYLMEEELDEAIKQRLEDVFNNRRLELDEVVKEVCNIIASMTNYTSIALGRKKQSESLFKIEVMKIDENNIAMILITNSGKIESKIFSVKENVNVDDLSKCIKVLNQHLINKSLDQVEVMLKGNLKVELSKYLRDYESILDAFINTFIKAISDEVYIGGRTNIINQPDFNDAQKIRKLINTLEDQEFFLDLARQVNNQKVMIGQEQNLLHMDDITIVSQNYNINDNDKGVIAIIGPTRMEYQKVVSILDYASNKINQLIKENRGENNEQSRYK